MNQSPHNLAHVCLLDGEGGLREFEARELDDWRPDHGPLWLHFELTDPDAQKWLDSRSGLSPMVVEALLEVESRPRLIAVGNGALLAFRGINHNEGAEPDDMVGIRIWLERDRVITSFRRNLRSVADLASQLREGEGPRSAAEVVTRLAGLLVMRKSDTIDDLEERIDDLEEQLLEGARSETRLALAELRRQVIAFRRYMAPQREALASLIASKFEWLDEEQRLSLRNTSDSLIRHLEDLDAIRERAAVTQEELQSRLAEQQNVRMYVLSIVAAVFLPLGFLTGMLGINVGGIPGAENPRAFWIFGGLLLAIVVAELVFFRVRKWY
jgi:zinc transporter